MVVKTRSVAEVKKYYGIKFEYLFDGKEGFAFFPSFFVSSLLDYS